MDLRYTSLEEVPGDWGNNTMRNVASRAPTTISSWLMQLVWAKNYGFCLQFWLFGGHLPMFSDNLITPFHRAAEGRRSLLIIISNSGPEVNSLKGAVTKYLYFQKNV